MKTWCNLKRLWLTRLLIISVIVWNLQAALAFLLAPAIYAPTFELSGVPGQAAVRGIAVLFFMWNVPYLLAAWHPRRNLLSLKEAMLMHIWTNPPTAFLDDEVKRYPDWPVWHALISPKLALRETSFTPLGAISTACAWWLKIPAGCAPG